MTDSNIVGPFFHGTTAALQPGDLLTPGYTSNFGSRRRANHVYITATMDAAGRIYEVEPLGHIEDDPNLTDKKFPGNPTKSYRTRDAVRVLREVVDWEGHPPEVLQHMRDNIARLQEQGIEAID